MCTYNVGSTCPLPFIIATLADTVLHLIGSFCLGAETPP